MYGSGPGRAFYITWPPVALMQQSQPTGRQVWTSGEHVPFRGGMLYIYQAVDSTHKCNRNWNLVRNPVAGAAWADKDLPR